jgi:hypothetical protein
VLAGGAVGATRAFEKSPRRLAHEKSSRVTSETPAPRLSQLPGDTSIYSAARREPESRPHAHVTGQHARGGSELRSRQHAVEIEFTPQRTPSTSARDGAAPAVVGQIARNGSSASNERPRSQVARSRNGPCASWLSSE